MGDFEVSIVDFESTENVVESMNWILISSFAFSLATVIIFFSAMFFLALKTKLPGRLLMLTSASLCVLTFVACHSLYGGSFEYAFGPIGTVFLYAAWLLCFFIFTAGLLRLCIYVHKNNVS